MIASAMEKADARGTTVAIGPLRPTNGVLTIRGYGVRLAVERGHLVVEDGVGTDRRRGRFSRVSPGFRRVIVIGYTGYVSLEATRWLSDLGITFAHIDTRGRVLTVGGPAGIRDARVIRGQVNAQETGAALAIARELLSSKVRGQAAVAERLADATRVVAYLKRVAEEIDRAPSVTNACYLEAEAAAAYWDAWSAVATQFVRRDVRRVPAHWRTFGQRQSPISLKQSKAATPPNAILNYLLAIVEAETRLALSVVGCDPALGLVHVDRMSRDSFALDVMEPVRPHVDAFVLDLLTTHQFTRAEFFEAGDGWCRLMSPLARVLAETAPMWSTLVAPIAERVATIFARSGGVRSSAGSGPVGLAALRALRPVRTPLTRRNQRLAGSSSGDPASGPVSDPRSVLPARCRSCGVKLTSRARKYCDPCWATVGREAQGNGARQATARRKAAGIRDRRSAPETQMARWPGLVAREAEHREWDAQHGPGPARDVFLDDLTPTLKSIPVDVLIAATGLSRPMCYRIRRGKSVPHWRHWEAIRAAVAAYTPPCPKEWEQLAGDTYERRIAPVLRTLPTPVIRAATGWSDSYISLVRRGHYLPHRRHWPVLMGMVGEAKRRG